MITDGRLPPPGERRPPRRGGVNVVEAMVVVDREEGGREKLAAEGIGVTSLFRRRDFMA